MSTRARPAATRPEAAPPPAAAYRLPSDQRSAAQARKALRPHLQVWHISGEPAYSAELLLSELVANAAQAQASAGPEVCVRFALSDGCLRLEVRDASDELPVMNEAKEDEECGRGLALVDALASGWGVDRDGTGKIVWAELAVGDASAPCRAPALRSP
ncbi:Histidine kinase-like ATPase domain-containing protein [Streptomyces sp. SceaMP-e96]|nr:MULTISPECIES: ATP-binding protein [unclassified Streptomyces]MYT11647.1 ATP-binding protein [Streptomyces sp. SID4951]SCK11321.1 Histidine kinase-like ATPase domain-containing protein [Streptomyces sp. SceaMP-e96]